MTSQFAGPARLARAGLVAGAVLGLAAGAHVLGGGVLPGPVAVGALGACLLLTTTALAGRRFTPGALGLGFGAGQLGLHTVLAALAPVGCAPPSAAAESTSAAVLAGGNLGAHAMHLGLGGLGTAASRAASACASGLAAASGLAPSSEAAGLHAAGSLGMLLAHVAATAVTVLLICSGERTLMWLLAWLRPLGPAPRGAGVAPGSRAVLAVRGENHGWRPRSEYLRASPRRGPPRPPAWAYLTA